MTVPANYGTEYNYVFLVVLTFLVMKNYLKILKIFATKNTKAMCYL